MATTHHWYIAAATGAKVDFTDPSADIDFTDAAHPTAKRELRVVKTDEGGSTAHPTVQLWKHTGEEVTTDEITDAIADQDDAAVPTLGQAPDPVSGYQHAAITDVPAVMADLTGGESPTEAEFNALLATVRLLRTAVNALITTGEGEGSVVPS
jgi:hypothetical protein